MRFLLFLLLSVPLTLVSQHPFLSRLTAVQVDDGVLLEWTLTAGNTCQGTGIERAGERAEFIEIGRIEGVCGSFIEDVHYLFLDEAPILGALNQYRLDLGAGGTSEAVALYVQDFSEAEFVLAMDEALQELIVHLKESPAIGQKLLIYSSGGQVLYEQTIASTEVHIDISHFPAGTFVLSMTRLAERVHSEAFVKWNQN